MFSYFLSLSSPLLLIALSVAGGGCFYISYKNQGQKIRVLGKNYSMFDKWLVKGKRVEGPEGPKGLKGSSLMSGFLMSMIELNILMI